MGWCTAKEPSEQVLIFYKVIVPQQTTPNKSRSCPYPGRMKTAPLGELTHLTQDERHYLEQAQDNNNAEKFSDHKIPVM